MSSIVSLPNFIDYVKSFYYGPDSVYNLGYTEQEIVYACWIRYQSKDYEGDTVDREMVRSYLETNYVIGE